MNDFFNLSAYAHGERVIHYYDLLFGNNSTSSNYQTNWSSNFHMLNFHIARYCDTLVHDLMTITEKVPHLFEDFISLHENSLPEVITMVERLSEWVQKRHDTEAVEKLLYQHNVLASVFMGMVTDEYLKSQLDILQ
jgi:hypothetical protein